MRAQTLEHDVDDLAAAPASMFVPSLLLGLQAGAGNAAVAGLIEHHRRTVYRLNRLLVPFWAKSDAHEHAPLNVDRDRVAESDLTRVLAHPSAPACPDGRGR